MRQLFFFALIISLSSVPCSASITVPASSPELAVRLFAREVVWSVTYDPGTFAGFEDSRTIAIRNETDPVVALKKMLKDLPFDFTMTTPKFMVITMTFPIYRSRNRRGSVKGPYTQAELYKLVRKR